MVIVGNYINIDHCNHVCHVIMSWSHPELQNVDRENYLCHTSRMYFKFDVRVKTLLPVTRPHLPVLTKAGPVWPVGAVSGKSSVALVIDGLVDADVVRDIGVGNFVILSQGGLSRFLQQELLPITASFYLQAVEISVDVFDAVVTARDAHRPSVGVSRDPRTLGVIDMVPGLAVFGVNRII